MREIGTSSPATAKVGMARPTLTTHVADQLAPPDVGQERRQGHRERDGDGHTAAHRRIVSPAASQDPVAPGPGVGVEEPLEQADVARHAAWAGDRRTSIRPARRCGSRG